MTKEVMQQALEALEKTQVEGYNLPGTAIREAITALREALAQPVQEPVTFYRCKGCTHAYEGIPPSSCDCMEFSSFTQRLKTGFTKVDYFTAPPPPVQRQPLTIKEINAMPEAQGRWPIGMNNRIVRLIRAVEAAHNIKEGT